MFYVSVLIPLAVIVPELISPAAASSYTDKKRSFLGVLEYIGRLGIFFIPAFYEVKLEDSLDIAAVIVMAISLVMYYLCWFRYYRRGRKSILLYAPLWIIPIPMSIMPVIYIASSSLIFNAIPVLISTVVYAVGCIPLALLKYKKIRVYGQ